MLDLWTFKDTCKVVSHRFSATPVIVEIAHRPTKAVTVYTDKLSYFKVVYVLYSPLSNILMRFGQINIFFCLLLGLPTNIF